MFLLPSYTDVLTPDSLFQLLSFELYIQFFVLLPDPQHHSLLQTYSEAISTKDHVRFNHTSVFEGLFCRPQSETSNRASSRLTKTPH